ncbi:MAG: AmmeMemoRadiSam system protein A [Spirochaetales bacterium]
MELFLTDREKKLLLSLARETVSSALEGKPVIPPVAEGNLCTNAGVFVTIHKTDGSLRGCIGQLYGKSNLVETVREVALSSAFNDPRFTPVKKEELKDLVFEISILSPLRQGKAEEIIPGKHGIYLKRGYSGGLLLPQVAVEQGWDRWEFLDHGCRKAGLLPGSWKDPYTELYLFTALVFKEEPKSD